MKLCIPLDDNNPIDKNIDNLKSHKTNVFYTSCYYKHIMDYVLLVIFRYLVFTSGRNIKKVDAEPAYGKSGDDKVYATTEKLTFTTAEYYDYEHETAPTIKAKTTRRAFKAEDVEYERTTLAYKDNVTDVLGILVTKRLSKKKKRKLMSKLDEEIFNNITITEEYPLPELPSRESLEEVTESFLEPTSTRRAKTKTTVSEAFYKLQVPDLSFRLLEPAGFIILLDGK